MLRIVNMSLIPEQVKIVQEEDGKIINTDFINVMPKRQVRVPDGYTVDKNWAVLHPAVRILNIDNSMEA